MVRINTSTLRGCYLYLCQCLLCWRNVLNSNSYVLSIVDGTPQYREKAIECVMRPGDKIIVLNPSAEQDAAVSVRISISAVDTNAGKEWHIENVGHISLEAH